MKDSKNWQPSKYIYKNSKLIASRNNKEVSIGSRLIADIVAGIYDENIRIYASGKLLDLGCGKVPLYIAYKNYVTDNVCVDWGNTFHKNEFLDFECDLTKDLPFDEGEFDTIILSDVLEHIPQPEHLWNQMSRVLSKNGKIMMNVPFFYPIHEKPHDYYRYTEFALRRFVENAGLKVITVKPIGGSPEILADVLGKHLQFIPIIGAITTIFIQFVTKLFINTSVGKKISEKTAKAFPLGYFLIAEKV